MGSRLGQGFGAVPDNRLFFSDLDSELYVTAWWWTLHACMKGSEDPSNSRVILCQWHCLI